MNAYKTRLILLTGDMFFAALLTTALIIIVQSHYQFSEELKENIDKRRMSDMNPPRCSVRRCETSPHVCEKSQMRRCYSALEIMTSTLGKNILCDTKTDEGGWIFIQRRIAGDMDFVKNWAEYKQGFGSLSGDFWIGLDFIHRLTWQINHELRIDLKFQRRSYYAKYSSFYIDSEANFYTLHVSGYSGDAGDGMDYHNNLRFRTIDRPTSNHCSRSYKAGWWFDSCYHAFLNGLWVENKTYDGIRWDPISLENTLQSAEMKIRRK
ncbi:ficolin-1-A-like [Physella acuta]|uniref:ficolin-1-A-like n=1 Tax=Physella acuta TaxID=109671 RepID=UPI0027DAF03A|nr:ficolin-1-A-like [Physella acuta]